MTNEEFELMCQTYANVILNPLLPRDEGDAKYEIRWYFSPENFTIKFTAFKIRDPRYMLNIARLPLCEIKSYDLDNWYKTYSSIRAKMFGAKWILDRAPGEVSEVNNYEKI